MAAKKAKRVTRKAASKKRRSNKAPSAKQLAARRKFALAAKARARAAKAKKATTRKRNKTVIVKPKQVVVLNPKKKPTKKGAVKRRNPRYFVIGIDAKGREHDLAIRVAMNKTQTLQWAKQHYPGFKKYVVTLSDKADYIGRTGMIKAKRPKRLRNSSTTAIDNRKEFAGKYGGDLTLHFPQKNLTGLSTLGPLVLLQGEFGTIKPTKGGVYYCQDAKGRIHIGAKDDGDLWAHVKENLGAVHRVEYRAAKPHLGYPKVITWYHDFEAPYPILKADGDGGLAQVGGGYTIKREGIVG